MFKDDWPEMKSIADTLQGNIFIADDKCAKSERGQILKELYDIYTCGQEKKNRSKENWKRYCDWCREMKYPDIKINRKIFRQSWRFIRELNIKVFCIKLSHLSQTDLYYILSISRDKYNRQELIGAWIFSSIKIKNPYLQT